MKIGFIGGGGGKRETTRRNLNKMLLKSIRIIAKKNESKCVFYISIFLHKYWRSIFE